VVGSGGRERDERAMPPLLSERPAPDYYVLCCRSSLTRRVLHARRPRDAPHIRCCRFMPRRHLHAVHVVRAADAPASRCVYAFTFCEAAFMMPTAPDEPSAHAPQASRAQPLLRLLLRQALFVLPA